MPTLNKISVDNVVYDIGSSLLIVTLAMEEEGGVEVITASHTPAQIKAVLDEGKLAYLSLSGVLDNGGYVPFIQASDTDATASVSYSYGSSEIGVMTFFIDENKEVSGAEVMGVSQYGNQTISGVKTFNTLPESPAMPTADNQLAIKKYVDDHDYNITSGTADPSGGSDGDIYLKYDA